MHTGMITGKCADFLKSSSCKEVEPGEGAVARCISDLVSAAEAGDTQDAGVFVCKKDKRIDTHKPCWLFHVLCDSGAVVSN